MLHSSKMNRLSFTILLLFCVGSVLGGYSTGFHRTRQPKPETDGAVPIADPPAHPKQRFVGHHEGSIRGTDGAVPVAEPPAHPKQRFIGHHEGAIRDVKPNSCFQGGDESIPAELPDQTKNIESDIFPPKEIDRPKEIIEPYPPKEVQIEEKPGPIDRIELIGEEKQEPFKVIIDENPETVIIPINDGQIGEKPGPILVDVPKIIEEEKPVPFIPSLPDERPIPIIPSVQVEEQPIPFVPSEPDEKQIKTVPEVPYPVKVTNEHSNLNLYEMLQKMQLSRFVHLVEEAGLQELLSRDAPPITIFAPSDYALSKLKADEIRRLATNPELLRQFVLYHCVDGSIYGPALINDPLKTRIDRNILMANYYGEKWYVNGREIKIRDQVCKNGAIHTIDYPLYPFPTGGILETLEESGNFKIFTELIRNAKLDEVLKREHRWTIFAPTDAAFSKLPPANVEWLKWDIPAIKQLFNQVTCRGYYYTSWINSGSTSPPLSLADQSLDFSGYPDSTINGIKLSQRDITADNGCIHAIDDIWFGSDLSPAEDSVAKKS